MTEICSCCSPFHLFALLSSFVIVVIFNLSCLFLPFNSEQKMLIRKDKVLQNRNSVEGVTIVFR